MLGQPSLLQQTKGNNELYDDMVFAFESLIVSVSIVSVEKPYFQTIFKQKICIFAD